MHSSGRRFGAIWRYTSRVWLAVSCYQSILHTSSTHASAQYTTTHSHTHGRGLDWNSETFITCLLRNSIDNERLLIADSGEWVCVCTRMKQRPTLIYLAGCCVAGSRPLSYMRMWCNWHGFCRTWSSLKRRGSNYIQVHMHRLDYIAGIRREVGYYGKVKHCSYIKTIISY